MKENLIIEKYIFVECLGVTVAMMRHHDQKQAGEESVYLTYTSTSQFITGGSQGRNSGRILEAGAGAEAMEGCCLLACSPGLAQPAFL